MNTVARIVPSYRAIIRIFEKPMRHGDGRRFLTNPAINGQSERGELFGNVVCANGRYYVVGPDFTGGEHDLQTAAITGNVTHFNRHHPTPAHQVYQCASTAEALIRLWALVVEHYGITDASEQVAQALLQSQVTTLTTEQEQDDEDILNADDLETALDKLLKS